MRAIWKNVFTTTFDILDKSETDVLRFCHYLFTLSSETWGVEAGDAPRSCCYQRLAIPHCSSLAKNNAVRSLLGAFQTTLSKHTLTNRFREFKRFQCRLEKRQTFDSACDENSNLSHLHGVISMRHFQRWHNDVISNEIIGKKKDGERAVVQTGRACNQSL